MRYPLALILGSDMKPAKLRVCRSEDKSVFDLWLVHTELKSLINEKYVLHTNDAWVFNTYEWLPLLDYTGRVIRDGIVITDTYFPEKTVYEALVGKITGKPLSVPYTLVDVFGKHRLVTEEEIFNFVRRSPKKLFCNLDHEKLVDIHGHSNIVINTDSVRYVVKDTNISSDISALCSDMQLDVQLSLGRIEVVKTLGSASSIIIPDYWRSVGVTFGAIMTTETLVFPEEMSQLDLNVNGSLLRSIALPKVVNCRKSGCPGFSLYLIAVNNLEELVLPDELLGGEHRIIIIGCRNLHTIRQRPGIHAVSKVAQLSIKGCPNVKIVDTPYYSYNSTMLEHVEVVHA